MIKKFLWKNKIAIGACVLTITFGIGYWVLSSPGTTTIGEDITAGGRVCDGFGNCLDTVGGAGFPAPNYNSGWVLINQGEIKYLTHNLGGNTDNYVVDLQCKYSTGPHQWFYGFYEGGAYGQQGIAWSQLTTTQIKIQKSVGDDYCLEARVRIWAY